MLFFPLLVFAGTKDFGENCQADADCISNLCATSTLTTPDNKFCACSSAADCENKYKKNPPTEVWTCVGGAEKSKGLPFCNSDQRGTQIPEPILKSTTKPAEEKTEGAKQITLTVPKPEVQIPGLPDWTPQTINEGDTAKISYLADYIIAIYKYGLIIGAILAVTVITIGGIMYLTAAGAPELITTAKNLIYGAISGVILLLGSYLLLTTINPNLVNLNPIEIQTIKGLEADYAASAQIGQQELAGVPTAIPQLINGKYSGLSIPPASSCASICLSNPKTRCADQKIRDQAYEAQEKTGYPAAVMIAQYLTEGPTFGSTCSGAFIVSEKGDKAAAEAANCNEKCGAGFTWECTKSPKYLPPKAAMDFKSGKTIDCGKGEKEGKGFTQVHGYRCFAKPDPVNIFSLLVKTYERIKCIREGRLTYGGDPVAFAKKVHACGYATAQSYSDHLISMMKKYCLIGTPITTTGDTSPEAKTE